MTEKLERAPETSAKFWMVTALGLLAAILAIHGIILTGGLFVEKDLKGFIFLLA